MKTYLLLAVTLLAHFVSLYGQDAGDRTVRVSWRAAKDAAYSQAPDPAEVAEAAMAMRNVLAKQAASPEDASSLIAAELFDFTVALSQVKAGDYGGAYQSLVAEVEAQKNAQRVLLANTWTPYAFARDLFELHSEIMAHTGNVAVPPDAGYKVFDVSSKDGPPSFAFVFEPVENVENGMLPIRGLAEDEQRQVIDLSAPDETGQYKITDRAQVIGKRDGVVIGLQLANGKPSLRVSGISKFVEYKGDFPFVLQSPVSSLELAIDRGKIEQPIDAAKVGMFDVVPDDGNPPSDPPHPTKTKSPSIPAAFDSEEGS